MDPALLAEFSSDPDALLHEISRHISDDILHYIAKADYGYDAQENFLQLRNIRDGGVIATPLPWAPGEVLSLIRWSQPERTDWPRYAQGLSRAQGHLAVAFSCAV